MANGTYYPFTGQLVRVSACGLYYKFAYLLDTHTSAFPDMSFDSYWLSRLSGEEYMDVEPSTHPNAGSVVRPGNFNMQPGYAWASTYSSSSSISFSRYHPCRSIVCVNPIFILPPSPAESRRLRTSQASVPGNTSCTENHQSPPAENYGLNDVSLHVRPRRISLDEDVPPPVNAPPSFSTFLQDGKKRFLCECGTETAREADMKRHQRYALRHSQPQFACDQCGKTLTRKDACDAHRETCPAILQNEFPT